MTTILYFIIFAAGGTLGLFVGCALGMNTRADILDELEAAEAEVDRLRGRVG